MGNCSGRLHNGMENWKFTLPLIYGASRSLLYIMFLTEFSNTVTSDKFFCTFGLMIASNFVSYQLMGSLHLPYYKLVRISIMSIWLMPKLSVSRAIQMYFMILMLDKTLWTTWKKITKALETYKFEDLNRIWEEALAEFDRQEAENE